MRLLSWSVCFLLSPECDESTLSSQSFMSPPNFCTYFTVIYFTSEVLCVLRDSSQSFVLHPNHCIQLTVIYVTSELLYVFLDTSRPFILLFDHCKYTHNYLCHFAKIIVCDIIDTSRSFVLPRKYLRWKYSLHRGLRYVTSPALDTRMQMRVVMLFLQVVLHFIAGKWSVARMMRLAVCCKNDRMIYIHLRFFLLCRFMVLGW